MTSLPFSWRLSGVLGLSGIAAFFVNYSGFLVMGACSALTRRCKCTGAWAAAAATGCWRPLRREPPSRHANILYLYWGP